MVATGPAPHKVSRALRAQNPGRVRKSPERVPQARAPKVPKECARSLKRVRKEPETPDFWTLFGLVCDSGAHFFGTFGPGPGYSFRTLFGLFRGSGPEVPRRPLCGAGPQPNGMSLLQGFVGI